MTNTPQIDAFIKRMKTPLYAKTPPEFKYGRLMGRALRIERALESELKEALRENKRLRHVFRVNILRLAPETPHDEIDRVLNDEPHH